MFEAAETGAKLSKSEYQEAQVELRVDLINAQYDLRDAGFAVLVLLEGDDRPGINETLKLLHEWMDGRYLVTRAFDVSPERADCGGRPPFTRFWRELPAAGQIGIFCKAWTLDAIAGALAGELDDAALERYVDHIRALERALADDDVALLKLWLHLPEDELRKRVKKGRERQWRLSGRDFVLEDRYDEALALAESVLARTGEAVPWTLVESTDDEYRNLTVARAVLEVVRERLAGAGAGAERKGSSARKGSSKGEAVAPPAALGESHPHALAEVDLTVSLEKDEYEERLDKAQRRLVELSESLVDAGTTSVLVFEGWDAAGKGGCIRRLTRLLDPQDYRVIPIGAPSDEERAHHWLWRFWRALPPPGTLWILDRSWYGRVLVERVEGFARPDEWQRAYAEINDFEAQLTEHGMPLAKFWLQIDPAEQLRRFEARATTPYKKYKLTPDDFRNRSRWPEYTAAANAMLARTHTPTAPWHLISSMDKRWARVQVAELACKTLERGLKKS